MTERQPTIVFDTDCALCSGMVTFILERERDQALRFLGAWSPEGMSAAARCGFSKADLDATFLLIRDGAALTRSDAALAILGHLRPPWRWLTIIKHVPKPLRDGLYGLFARHRYRWFGHGENCMIVPRSHMHRFIGFSRMPRPPERRRQPAKRPSI